MASHVVKDKDVVSATEGKNVSIESSDSKSKLEQRQFYHSHNFQPMSLDEVLSDRDSEDEVDHDTADLEERQRRFYQQRSDGMKVDKNQDRLMQLWNSFVRRQRVVADYLVPWACKAFTKLHQEELNMNLSLFWCWRLFLIKLWNDKLVDASTITKCTDILENKESTEISESSSVPRAPKTIRKKNSIPPSPLDVKVTVESTVSENGKEAEMDVGVDQSALLKKRKFTDDKESSQDADMTASTQKFVRKRPVKPTLKIREMQWATTRGRGSRGRGGCGRGGRGDHGNLN